MNGHARGHRRKVRESAETPRREAQWPRGACGRRRVTRTASTRDARTWRLGVEPHGQEGQSLDGQLPPHVPMGALRLFHLASSGVRNPSKMLAMVFSGARVLGVLEQTLHSPGVCDSPPPRKPTLIQTEADPRQTALAAFSTCDSRGRHAVATVCDHVAGFDCPFHAPRRWCVGAMNVSAGRLPPNQHTITLTTMQVIDATWKVAILCSVCCWTRT
jgi:hypothetical protein